MFAILTCIIIFIVSMEILYDYCRKNNIIEPDEENANYFKDLYERGNNNG